MDVVRYRCSKQTCMAVDDVRVDHGIPEMPCINCWKCGAGRGLSIADQLEGRVGMFPVSRVDEDTSDHQRLGPVPITRPVPMTEGPAPRRTQ